MLGKRLINTVAAAAPGACTTDTLDLEGMPSGGETNVAVYKLDGNATDVTGNYNGNLVAGSYVAGKFGQAASFNGSSTYMTIGNPVASNIYSFSIWIKPTVVLPSGIGAILGGSGTTLTYYQHNNGSLLIYNGGSYLEATNFFQDTNWVHLVAVSNGSNLLIYRNGALFATLGASITLNSITFGKHPLYAVEYFNGSLDQIRIFNKVLDSTEANTLYNETVATTSTLLFPNPSIVAYYKLDSTAADVTGNYDGTATNVTYTNSGQFSQAAVFNGTSSFIDTNAKIPASLDFSVSFWMKSSDTSTGTHFIFSTKGNYATNGWFISNDAGYIRYGEGNGVDNATSQLSPSIVANGSWNHVVVTRASGGTINMYVNGSRVITDGSVGAYFMTSSTWAYDLHIGRYAASSDLFYDGQIDQIRIYNKALSQANVETLYNEVQCPCTTDTVDYPTTNVAYYKLDGNPQDSTTNGYDGVATNVTYNTGKFGQAGVFNGSTSQIQIAQSILSSNATASFSCWAKGASFANTGSPDIIFQNTQGGFYFALLTSSSNFEVYIRNSSGTNITAIQYPLSNFNTVDWYNIVVTFSGLNSAINLYVNNSLVATATAPSSIISYALNNSIGGETGTSTLGWNGSIDQVRIFDTALTAAQVTDLYDEVYCKPPVLDFETTTYPGTGSSENIYNTGFQPDLIWFKERNGTNAHQLYDTVRGDDFALYSNQTSAQYNYSTHPSGDLSPTINEDGFATPAVTNNGINRSGGTYVAWQWKAGGSTSTYNIDDVGYATASAAGLDSGTINPTGASVNTAKGFSIVKWTGANTSSTSVAHGLNVAPEMVILRHTDVDGDWRVYHDGIPDDSFLYLNQTSTLVDINVNKNYTATTISQQWTAGSYNWLAYCWHSVAGHSKIGSYTGTGLAGNFVSTSVDGDAGFEPAFVMWKAAIRPSGGGSWYIYDNKRTTSNPQGQYLQANEPAQEFDGTSVFNIDFNSNGFTVNGTNNEVNQSGSTYIFMAFA